ncbi:hypothetical protein ACUXCC_000776 [Cytobacillus horneckiae]|uniref:hypothetical protein n=1 Tax=Cytobacillus horneckiae TaxID=549687 RepID=UPI0019D0FBEE|nr:hypothetical protein [Cytobacillus horneckiae]MBN6886120.1 hypothetical protein [Cytobacillus horneckiae]
MFSRKNNSKHISKGKNKKKNFVNKTNKKNSLREKESNIIVKKFFRSLKPILLFLASLILILMGVLYLIDLAKDFTYLKNSEYMISEGKVINEYKRKSKGVFYYEAEVLLNGGEILKIERSKEKFYVGEIYQIEYLPYSKLVSSFDYLEGTND